MPLSSEITKIRPRYEVVVVGSGYGGAVAASRMSRAFRSVCVLERGREHPSGTFPSKTLDVLGDIQVESKELRAGKSTGIYRFLTGGDVWAVVACGLGGGSLMNAGVCAKPIAAVFDDRWPAALRSPGPGQLPTELAAHYDLAKEVLSPRAYPTVGRAQPKRLQVLERLTADPSLDLRYGRAEIAVSFEDGKNQFHVDRKSCVDCGDCVSGCNFHSKNTLDTNYLADAWNHGAELYTQVTANRLERAGSEWLVHYTAGDELGKPLFDGFVRADVVILGAGTFGSTGILKRSAEAGLPLSPRIGRAFSANGDVFGFSWATPHPLDAIGTDGHENTKSGPTILGMCNLRDPDAPRGVVVQDGAIPGGLVPDWMVRLAQEAEAGLDSDTLARQLKPPTANTDGDSPDPRSWPAGTAEEIRAMRRGLDERLGRPAPRPAGPLAGDTPAPGDSIDRIMNDSNFAGAIERTLPMLGTSYDDAQGEIAFAEDRPYVVWPGLDLDSSMARMRLVSAQIGGWFVPNPITTELGGKKQLTAHPLGGCGMADRGSAGVVDDCGRVFDGENATVQPGLYVFDGSTIPVALGINPLFTITALAERACQKLAIERGWHFDPRAPSPVRTPDAPLGVAARFSETMEGPFARGAADFDEAIALGRQHGSTLTQDLTIFIDDVDKFVAEPQHEARMAGSVTASALSDSPLAASNATFQQFVDDPSGDGVRIVYRMVLDSVEGARYHFEGIKYIRDDPGFDMLKDNTTLFVTVRDGVTGTGPIVGRGVLTIGLVGVAKLLSSVRVLHSPSDAATLGAAAKFAKFYVGTLWETYA